MNESLFLTLFNRNKMRLLFLLLFISASKTSISQTEFDYRRFTQKMCSPQFHGRGYVNKGDSIAGEYIAEKMIELGIDSFPFGYFQTFNLDVNTFPDQCKVAIDGRELRPGIDYIVMPFSDGNCIKNKCDEIVKYNIVRKSGREILTEPKKILNEITAGDILVVDNTGYSKDSSIQIQGFLKELCQLGIPIAEMVSQKFTWSLSTYKASEFYIQMKTSNLNTSDSSIDVLLRNKLIYNYQSRNVIGMIPAKRESKGTIMLTAHYDHLGRMGSATYFPGANDNASGVAMLLQLGHMIRNRPIRKYDVILVAFAGEEIGLLGSKHMSETNIIDLNRVKFLLNLDIMGSGEEGITAVNGRVFSKEFKRLQKLNGRYKSVPVVKSRGKSANSDHHFFTEKGVHSFFIYTMGKNKNYHDVYDTYENLTFSSFDNLSRLFDSFLRRL